MRTIQTGEFSPSQISFLNAQSEISGKAKLEYKSKSNCIYEFAKKIFTAISHQYNLYFKKDYKASLITKANEEIKKATLLARDVDSSQLNLIGNLFDKSRAIVQYDAGEGNELYIRGEGTGLSWDKGIKLINVDSNVWFLPLSIKPSDITKFKIVLNDGDDAKFENGDDRTSFDNVSPDFS